MENTSQQQPLPYQNAQVPLGGTCNILKMANGDFIITGDANLLREYFESSPEQWLRCLALTKKGEKSETR